MRSSGALLAALSTLAAVTTFSLAEYEPCPHTCSCLGHGVQCSNLDSLPDPSRIPGWTKTLIVDNIRNPPPASAIASFAALDLHELKLERCRYETVPDVGFAPHLRILGLAHNRITAVDLDPLGNATRLEELSLEQNRIETLAPDRFARLNRLRILRLSNNRIHDVRLGAFAGLGDLVDLRLNRNRIAGLPHRLFADQRQLEKLDLSKNRLSEIDGLFFRELGRLTSLKLRHNKIKSFKDGAFYGLDSLKELRLDQNQISTVSKTWMYGLKSLVALSISHNRLATVDAGCWEVCSQLKELDLSGNSLRSLDEQTFEHLSRLRSLKLDGNEIASVSENTFAHMSALESLDLSHNRISWTVEDMNAPFSGLKYLRAFSLAHNHIKSVGDEAFVDLESLSVLNLNGNNITTLQEKAFSPLSSLRELHINTSSLLCDCDLKWFSYRASKLPQRNTIKAACAYPARLQGLRLLDLDAESLNCDDSPKPRIREHPKTKMAIKGETARLYCRASSSGSSRIEFSWRRNDLNITSPEVNETVVESEDNTVLASSELILKNVSDSDSGRYQCIASNGYGTAYSNKSLITIVIFPKFIKIPANITVNAGETAKLECAAAGDPPPEIAWQKDGGNNFPAARERRMHVMPTDDVFFIINAKTNDTGVYSCTAQSIAGSVISNATLTVLEAPSIVNDMENKEITAGESVVIECMVSGTPKPSLRWLKDGAPIVRTERHFFTAEEQLLIIVGAVPGDEGIYECEISNDLGTDKDSTKLRVLPAVSTYPLNSDEDMMGIIIITVVCCAVGTSIVWVFIIYQTRKRMNRALPQFAPESLQLDPLTMGGDMTSPHLFADNISERSSCKDSGTGDSAKRSSLEVNPSDEPQPTGSPRIVYVKPSDESRLLLKKDDNMKAFYSEDCDHTVVQMHMPGEVICDNGGEDSANRTYPYS